MQIVAVEMCAALGLFSPTNFTDGYHVWLLAIATEVAGACHAPKVPA
jgi:hypothetical protein